MPDIPAPHSSRRLARRIERDADTTRWWIIWHDYLAGRSKPQQPVARVLALLFRIETARNDDHDLPAARSYLDWCERTAKLLRHNSSDEVPGLEMQWRAEAAAAGIRVIPALDVLAMMMLIVGSFGAVYCTNSLTLTTGLTLLAGSTAIYLYITHAALRTAVGPDAPALWWSRWRPWCPHPVPTGDEG